MSHAEPQSPRKLVCALLIVIAAAGVAGRIAATSRVYEPEMARDEANPADRRGKWPARRPRPMPTFSSNDRSRWATVRALVDNGTYVIGRRDRQTVLASAVALLAAPDGLQGTTLAAAGYYARTGADSGIIFEDGYQSVDKILSPETLEYYSTKPPLLSTLVAGLYWLLQKLFGWTLAGEPFTVVRTILVIVNLIPFVVYLVVLWRLLDMLGASEWTAYFVLAAACFATLVGPFLITLNNHTVATFCVLFAVACVLPLLQPPWRREPIASSGIACRLAAAGFFASFTATNELPALAFVAALFALLVWRLPWQTLAFFVPAALVPLAGLMVTNYLALGEFQPAYEKFGGPWYEFEGSHWRKAPPGAEPKHGIDWAGAHETRAAYAFHVLVGHHGLFSLTPLWLMAVAGMAAALRWLRPGQNESPPQTKSWSVLAGLTLALTVVVVGFYLVKSDNYGGFTVGLRWLMWLTPLWLLTMVPIVEWLGQRRWGRWLALALLAWSIFSANYPPWNPWRHPWLYNLLESGGYFAY